VAQVGSAACGAIIQGRESGEFRSYEDFCERVPRKAVNSSARKNLVKAGAFGRLHQREELLRRMLEEQDAEVPDDTSVCAFVR
jgi:DNA polymerase-3 subunit alpha